MRGRVVWAWGLASVVLGLGVACSSMIEADLAQVSCSREGEIGPPDCPAGHSCRAGACAPCAAQDICGNGIDDDCDRLVDDGCTDGASGGAGGGGAGSGGDVGGGGTAGSGGTFAGGGTGGGGTGGVGGVAGSGGGGTGGGGGSGGTGGVPAGSIGSPCATSAECAATLFCENPAVFGGTSGPKVCTRACCKSDDCGSGSSVCYPAVHGGSACVPAASVGRAEPGAGAAGDTCAKHSDCRSGLCEASKCFDTCCSDQSCSGSQYCVKRTLPGTTRSVWACGTSPGSGGYQIPCGTDSSCQSGFCTGAYCSKPCCTAKDCGGTLANLACWHVSGIRRCYYPGFSPGPKNLGEVCANNAECKTGHCVGNGTTGYYCSDTCCSNSDCGGGFSCRAVSVSGTNQLLCVKL
ncbi:MAG: hypothetical protein IT377_19190 [Polyangiaceae bacterium]|nr:hypothetical protein [Polyangiaceae bacterium]